MEHPKAKKKEELEEEEGKKREESPSSDGHKTVMSLIVSASDVLVGSLFKSVSIIFARNTLSWSAILDKLAATLQIIISVDRENLGQPKQLARRATAWRPLSVQPATKLPTRKDCR